jgi:tetratricopeptide (TPR) repeat protein
MMLCSCSRPQSGPAIATSPPLPDSKSVATPPPAPAPAVPPPPRQQAEIQEALRGLRFTSGLIEIDTQAASEIVPAPTPAEAPAERGRGRDALGRRDFPQAMRAYVRAFLHDPASTVTLIEFSDALLSARQTAESAAACRSALQLDSADLAVRERLAHRTQFLGQYAESADAWNTILVQNPDHVTGRARRAVLLYYLEQYADAWALIHETEARDQPVPSQLRELLAEQMPEPP